MCIMWHVWVAHVFQLYQLLSVYSMCVRVPLFRVSWLSAAYLIFLDLAYAPATLRQGVSKTKQYIRYSDFKCPLISASLRLFLDFTQICHNCHKYIHVSLVDETSMTKRVSVKNINLQDTTKCVHQSHYFWDNLLHGICRHPVLKIKIVSRTGKDPVLRLKLKLKSTQFKG
jgi:hypothetical protein